MRKLACLQASTRRAQSCRDSHMHAGVFMLRFAKCIAEGLPLMSFSQRDMPFIRMEIAHTLYLTRTIDALLGAPPK